MVSSCMKEIEVPVLNLGMEPLCRAEARRKACGPRKDYS